MFSLRAPAPPCVGLGVVAHRRNRSSYKTAQWYTTMNVLFAWELGANFGHLARQLPVARELAARGHRITFVVRDTALASKLLTPHGYRFIQAPLMVAKPRLRVPPANYSEILLAEGFHDKAALAGRVQAWLNLFEIIRPDSILIDHAPTALLAARIAGVHRVMFGNGFEIPPAQSPYPNFRAWEGVPDSRLIKSENLALANINAVCRAHRQAPLHAVHEIFDGATQALITLPELDHYGAREANYLGPIHAQLGGARVEWPKAEGKRILAYLRPDVPGFSAMVEVLKARATPTILIAPSALKAWVDQHTSQTLSVQTGPIQIEPLLTDCDLGISYGGSGTLSQFVLAGIPQLILPKNVEQYLGGLRIQQLGAGQVVEKARARDDLAAVLDHILVTPSLGGAARAMVARYAHLKPEQAVASVARNIEQQQTETTQVRRVDSPGESRLVH